MSEERFVPALPANVKRALEALKARLARRFASSFGELRLFGSYARGEQHDESDVDVLVIFENEAWDRDGLFREVAEVDVAEKVWISPLPLTRKEYAQMIADEAGIAEAIESEGIRI